VSDVTRILDRVQQGEAKAAEELLPLVYSELRKLAAHKLSHEAPGQTLQPTALVHKAWLRLVGTGEDQNWNGRGHFFGAAAEAMRRILVENARRKQRIKCGGGWVLADFTPAVQLLLSNSPVSLEVRIETRHAIGSRILGCERNGTIRRLKPRTTQPAFSMKISILSGLAALMARSLIAADLTPKDVVTASAKKLGEQTNYTWTATVVVPDDAPFKPGLTKGKTEKEGFATVSLGFFDNQLQVVLKGSKTVTTSEDGSWKTLEELDQQEGPGRFLGILVRGIKRPADEAAGIVSFTKELKKDGDVYSSVLTEEGAKALQTFKMPGGDSMAVNDAKGSARFWIKDGVLTKYEFKLKGLLKFGDNEFPNDRTTTVEIRDVNNTKVEVPEAAKKKLS